MSTIAARAHSGSTLSAPVRRAAPIRRKTSWLSGLARTVRRRPGRALLVLSFAGVAGAILLNAVLFQKARHPAPMAVRADFVADTPRRPSAAPRRACSEPRRDAGGQPHRFHPRGRAISRRLRAKRRSVRRQP
jgi:hypothetical protein